METSILIENKRKDEIFTATKDDITASQCDLADVTLVCKDGQRLEAHKRLLGLCSPMMRELLGCQESSLVSLQDFSLASVGRVLELLSLGWQGEQFLLSREEVELLTVLGVRAGRLEKVTKISQEMAASKPDIRIDVKKFPQSYTKKKVSTSYVCELCEEDVTEIEEHFETEHRKWNKMGNISLDEIISFFRVITPSPQPQPEYSGTSSHSFKTENKVSKGSLKPLLPFSNTTESKYQKTMSPCVVTVKHLNLKRQTLPFEWVSITKPPRSVTSTTKPMKTIKLEITTKMSGENIKSETRTTNPSKHHKRGNLTIKCPRCTKKFDGKSQANLKKCLHNHIGLVHYGKQLSKEIVGIFEGDKCLECEKEFKYIVAKQKHILFNHTKHAREVLSQTMNALSVVKEEIIDHSSFKELPVKTLLKQETSSVETNHKNKDVHKEPTSKLPNQEESLPSKSMQNEAKVTDGPFYSVAKDLLEMVEKVNLKSNIETEDESILDEKEAMDDMDMDNLFNTAKECLEDTQTELLDIGNQLIDLGDIADEDHLEEEVLEQLDMSIKGQIEDDRGIIKKDHLLLVQDISDDEDDEEDILTDFDDIEEVHSSFDDSDTDDFDEEIRKVEAILNSVKN